jgi:hypothetical protein
MERLVSHRMAPRLRGGPDAACTEETEWKTVTPAPCAASARCTADGAETGGPMMDYKELFDKSFKLAAELREVKAENARLRAELDAFRKDAAYYLTTNEEKGVVYIPKFVVEKWRGVKGENNA